MSKPIRVLADLLRLFLFIILLPLLLLLTGPLLVIAAIMGKVSIFGKVELAPGKHHRRGRVWAFVMGMLLWMLIWAGVAWLATVYLGALTVNPAVTGNAPATPTATFTVIPSPITRPEAVESPLPPTPDNTAAPTRTAAATATSTSVALSAFTDTPTPQPTLTSTPTVESMMIATVIASPVVTVTPPLPTVTLTPAQEREILNTLNRANNALISALQSPGSLTYSALGTVWRQDALQQVHEFAMRISEANPDDLQVRYVIIGNPTYAPDETSNDVIVTNREHWIFEANGEIREALNEYTYTLREGDDGWLIIAYRFTTMSDER